MADMDLDQIMVKAKELYAGAQSVGSIGGARQAAMTAASLVYYLAKNMKEMQSGQKAGKHGGAREDELEAAAGSGKHATKKGGAREDEVEAVAQGRGPWHDTHGVSRDGVAPGDKAVDHDAPPVPGGWDPKQV